MIYKNVIKLKKPKPATARVSSNKSGFQLETDYRSHKDCRFSKEIEYPDYLINSLFALINDLIIKLPN